MDTVRLVDHLLSTPSQPLVLSGEDREGWEPLLDPPSPRFLSWILAAAAAALVLLSGTGDADEDPRDDDAPAMTSRR